MQSINKLTVPDGCLVNAEGHFVPKDLISEVELLQNDLVINLVHRAQQLSEKLAQEKADFFKQIEDFMVLSASEYNIEIGGKKGNISLISYSGNFKVERAVQDKMVFDHRLQIAKELVDKCIEKWSEGAHQQLLALVKNAFQVDTSGKINSRNVLQLRRYKIENDPNWTAAMRAINDSLTFAGSSTYMRFYVKNADGKWQQISLDFASAQLAPAA